MVDKERPLGGISRPENYGNSPYRAENDPGDYGNTPRRLWQCPENYGIPPRKLWHFAPKTMAISTAMPHG